VKKAFKQCSILPVPSLGFLLPFHQAFWTVLNQSIGTMTYLQNSPAWEMSQPGEKLNRVSTHKSGLKETVSKVVDGLDVTILFRLERRIAIEDRQCHRRRGATKMLIPSRGTTKQVTGQKDSFCRLGLEEVSN